MQIYVGITDYDWYQFLKQQKSEEVNFWKPGTQPFKALQENELFLFKLHAPQNYIVGGGYFVKYSLLPTYLALLIVIQTVLETQAIGSTVILMRIVLLIKPEQVRYWRQSLRVSQYRYYGATHCFLPSLDLMQQKKCMI